jgi:hypothetical protein
MSTRNRILPSGDGPSAGLEPHSDCPGDGPADKLQLEIRPVKHLGQPGVGVVRRGCQHLALRGDGILCLDRQDMTPERSRTAAAARLMDYGRSITTTRSWAANGGAKPNWLSSTSRRPLAILAVVKVRLGGVGVTETSLPDSQSPSSLSSLI